MGSYVDLGGKNALVSGSGKRTGIGYAIAARLAASGANVIITDLGAVAGEGFAVRTGSREEMEQIAAELAERYGVKTAAVDLDVAKPESVAALAERVAAEFGRLHVLCNNAGASFGVPSSVLAYDEQAWLKTIDVNLHGVFRVTRALLPLMMEQGGSIVNTASRAGKVPPLLNGAYAVAKAGVIMLTKVLAKELAPLNIRVNAICPGQIMTDLERWRFGLEADFTGETIEQREAEMVKTIPLGRIGAPSEVGELVVFLASDAASYITGQAINVTGGQLMEL